MKVKIYTTPFCHFCHLAKEYLNRNGVKYEEINVQADPKAAREMITKTGQNGVPVLEIGDKIIIGFDQRKIAEALRS